MIASVVAAVLLPFILVIVMLLSIMDGASSHNVSAVDQVFREGAISSQVPEEYRKYIVDMRTSFTSLEDLIADIDHVEDGELDIEWVKSVFYAMYFGSAQPSLLAQKEFVDCFVEYEERRMRRGIPILRRFRFQIPEQSMPTSNSAGTGNRVGAGGKCTENLYGSCLWPGCSGRMAAGSAMGDGSYQALLTEATKYIGFPYRWGGSNPQTSFDCSGYICWIYTQSGTISCRGHLHREFLTSAL